MRQFRYVSQEKRDELARISGNRARVLAAFAELRKQGLIARANYLCCGGCAGAAIATAVAAMPPARRARVTGGVFWHKQDEERLGRDGKLYLRYGQVDTQEHGTIGWPSLNVGTAVVLALRAQGLVPEWDGDPDKCITVDLTQDTETAIALDERTWQAAGPLVSV